MTDPVNDGAVTPTTLSISVKDLADAGLEPQLRSWAGSGPNEPVTAEQITRAIGEDELARTAESLGLEPGALATGIAFCGSASRRARSRCWRCFFPQAICRLYQGPSFGK
ncbi:YidB family protein [Embleya sp. NPDC008237]|uniref:YidB family protein n=1 Tax=Embleya sp. NPDC008237 TaxID=3363978 RepID=UPI0036E7B47B